MPQLAQILMMLVMAGVCQPVNLKTQEGVAKTVIVCPLPDQAQDDDDDDEDEPATPAAPDKRT